MVAGFMYGLVNIYCLGVSCNQALRSKYFSHYGVVCFSSIVFRPPASLGTIACHTPFVHETLLVVSGAGLSNVSTVFRSEFDAIRDRSHDGNKP